MKKILIQQVKFIDFHGKLQGISFFNKENEKKILLKMVRENTILEKRFPYKSLFFPSLFSESLFFVNNNSLKNKFISIRFLLKYVKSFIKGMNQMFFLEFRIAGLGFKIFKFKKGFFDLKILCLKLGYSHLIQYIFPKNIHVLIGRRHLLFYTNDYNLLKMINKHLFYIKEPNPYKHKGLINVKNDIKLKIGKKQQR